MEERRRQRGGAAATVAENRTAGLQRRCGVTEEQRRAPARARVRENGGDAWMKKENFFLMKQLKQGSDPLFTG
jgi:hypothetical protein